MNYKVALTLLLFIIAIACTSTIVMVKGSEDTFINTDVGKSFDSVKGIERNIRLGGDKIETDTIIKNE